MSTKYKQYPKIKSFGYSGTHALLNSDIVIQPKVDGSNVSIWKCDEDLIRIGKRSSWLVTKFEDGIQTCMDQMFQPFANWVYEQDWSALPVDTVLWGEMLQNQNKLHYENKYPFMLFDSSTYKIDHEWHETSLEFLPWQTTLELSESLNIPMVPIIYEGPGSYWDYEKLAAIVTRPSYLGGCMEEGIVIKNYVDKTTFDEPLFIKIVGAEFKETMGIKTSPRKTMSMGEWVASEFFNTARLRKSIQKMKEDDRWDSVNEKKNIGPLIGYVTQDIHAEAYDLIQEEAGKRAWREAGKVIASKVAPTLDTIIMESQIELENPAI